MVCFVNIHPLDSDLSGGYRYPAFGQLGPEESGLIVANENEHFSCGNYETRSSKLADEYAKCPDVFEWSSCYNFLRLVAACSKMTRTSVKVKVRNTKLLPMVLLRAKNII